MPGQSSRPKPNVQAANITINGKARSSITLTINIVTILIRPVKRTICHRGKSEAILIQPIFMKSANNAQARKKLAIKANQGDRVGNIWPPKPIYFRVLSGHILYNQTI